MRVVGLRELKNRLSEYVREVRAGEQVLVTDRGHVVAELRAPGPTPVEPGLHPGIAALARRGLLSPGAPNDATRYPVLPALLSSERIRQLLDEERGPR